MIHSTLPKELTEKMLMRLMRKLDRLDPVDNRSSDDKLTTKYK